MPRKYNPEAPYPAQFRQQMIELVAAGRRHGELAKEFGCHETSRLSWMRAVRVTDSTAPTAIYSPLRKWTNRPDATPPKYKWCISAKPLVGQHGRKNAVFEN